MSNTLVVFTYAPAGLGHVRVANALMGGIPAGLDYAILAPSDRSTESMHRFSSLNVPARHVMEFFQRGFAEALFTKVYTEHLKHHTGKLSTQFIELIQSREVKPDKIVVVATHFGLAYQLGAIKSQLEKTFQTQIYLVVQVTDDSPQIIWYVDSADLIICPSHKTKASLQAFAAKNHLRQIPMEVGPYPIDLDFSKRLTLDQLTARSDQYNPTKESPINMVIPVSGAAVGMEFFLHLMRRLHDASPRFVFYVVCRKAPFTANFLRLIKRKDYVRLFTSSSYKEVVEAYKRVYLENVISAEVTKPSEQAFKALLRADSVGGSFLLFAEPVGRQEYDNINFLERHGLLSDDLNSRRGYILPYGSKESADLIWDLYSSGKMLNTFDKYSPQPPSDELGDDGVSKFWKLIWKACVILN
ncbi:MAG: hypothetical protein WC988_02735 [Patescibacteria group bacterium]